MSWYENAKQTGKNEGRWEALQELRKKEGEAANKTKQACMEELAKEDPKNIYYSSNLIRDFLADFYKADYDGDGRVSLHELCQLWRPNDEKAYKKLEEEFKAVEVTGDDKLTLAEFFILGFLGDDRKNNYQSAKKVDS
ncbi:uncharacterized protein BO97DRAFT_474437 [Aspergillus homomorphus CBS 101889]|uniref:EF-hand domain-containing protein n=1 Tax=Aspergillus homomorphus (strain CBS 101889) TaxID=1450537 RepID=A0A395IBR5_ASPHC|nr:hypothetical protein BO97DRAFT_474437 [Aspergillus homomorphus CBS 101889]RAL17435.1 hypothetical protein BO97DRAFT_474437 [Aspergillus homomorphus CBS 101889]